MGGVLYIVATPIGNLDDLSLRAARTLAQVAAVACEDTRQTAKLMDAAGAKRPLLSLHEHNERNAARNCWRGWWRARIWRWFPMRVRRWCLTPATGWWKRRLGPASGWRRFRGRVR